ncbi:unnamed protein product [Cuscuta europaea]|uniref:Uncharacterized protein n=1 Tax=Cuscuta europaea TaxID=41803 RepID=A0A9P0YM12_CUSEU|nr:unnamed protein product [Cuscuta europaea]
MENIGDHYKMMTIGAEEEDLASYVKATIPVIGMIDSQMNFLEVEILFYHTTSARPPPEPPPCEEVIWGKFLFSYCFSLRNTYFCFSSTGCGRSILIFDDELLINNVSFSGVLSFFLPVLCLASHVALYGWLTLSLFLWFPIGYVISVWIWRCVFALF